MNLPPVESSPTLLVRFSLSAPNDLITFFKERITSDGTLIILTSEGGESANDSSSKKSPVVLSITTTVPELEMEAEHVRLMKPTLPSKTAQSISIMEEFEVQNRERFVPATRSPEEGSSAFFSSGDRSSLCWSVLNNIRVLSPGKLTNNLCRKLDSMNIQYSHQPYRSTRKITSLMVQESGISTHRVLQVFEENGLIDCIAPVHNGPESEKILSQLLNPFKSVPLTEIRNYYGEEVAFYFAWQAHFTRALFVPAAVACLVYTRRWYNEDTVDTCELTPIFGMLMFLWAVVYHRFSERMQNRLAWEWGTFSLSPAICSNRHFQTRPEFEGELRISPVTGLMEEYYPEYRRRIKYMVSFFITLMLLGIAFFVIIFSLNLQGYIHPKHDDDRWLNEDSHPFYFPVIAQFAEEGRIFDCNHKWRCFIPTIIHVLCIMTMNTIYRKIATMLTKWENHDTLISHENSLIIKRFLFEAFDAYIALFYLAFFERDIIKLRGELVSVFNVDTFRRMLLEFVVPWLLQKKRNKAKDQQNAKAKKSEDGGISRNENNINSYTPLSDEAEKDEYEQFDDYLEMVVQLGYVCLFASAYPLAAVVAIFSNYAEIRTDAMKLTRINQRPRPIGTDSIGTWKAIITGIIWMSALTNCLIFGLTSQQMMQYLPTLFYLNDEGEENYVKGKGWIVVFIIFGLERLLMVIGLLLNAVIPAIPEDVTVKVQQQEYVRSQEARMLRLNIRTEEQKQGSEDIDNDATATWERMGNSFQ